MKGMYLGRRFYRQMFGAVLLTPVVVYVASLDPVITLGRYGGAGRGAGALPGLARMD